MLGKMRTSSWSQCRLWHLRRLSGKPSYRKSLETMTPKAPCRHRMITAITLCIACTRWSQQNDGTELPPTHGGRTDKQLSTPAATSQQLSRAQISHRPLRGSRLLRRMLTRQGRRPRDSPVRARDWAERDCACQGLRPPAAIGTCATGKCVTCPARSPSEALPPTCRWPQTGLS